MFKFLAFTFALSAYGLQTQYLSFDEPEGWKCEKSQRVYICQSKTEPDRKESLVMSIAMVATDWDNLQNYEQYLKAPKTIPDEKGQPVTSKVTYVRRRNINGYVWVDALHQNSELPGFYTRYLATVHNQLAILVTYIVSDERYTVLAPVFERMVSSLKPNKEFSLAAVGTKGDVPASATEVLGKQKNLIAERLRPTTPKADDVVLEESRPFPLIKILLIIAILIVAYFLIKRSKKHESQ